MNCYFSKKLVSSLLLVSFCCSPMVLRAPLGQELETKKDFYSQLSRYFIDTKKQEAPAASIATGVPAAKKPQNDVTLHTLSQNEMVQMTLEVLNHVTPKASVTETDINPLEKFTIKQPGRLDVAGKLMPKARCGDKLHSLTTVHIYSPATSSTDGSPSPAYLRKRRICARRHRRLVS